MVECTAVLCFDIYYFIHTYFQQTKWAKLYDDITELDDAVMGINIPLGGRNVDKQCSFVVIVITIIYGITFPAAMLSYIFALFRKSLVVKYCLAFLAGYKVYYIF